MRLKRLPLILTTTAFLCGCIPANSPTPSLAAPTATITWIPTHTPTNTPTLTFTPVPTLSPHDAYARVNEFLTNGPNCSLPCWMGIIPGQSTLLDIQTQLVVYSSISSDVIYEYPALPWLVSRMTILYRDADVVTELRSGYLSLQDENGIPVILFDSRAYKLNDGEYNGDVYGYPAYNGLLKAYTLSGILSKYGLPSQIYVMAELSSEDYIPDWWGYFHIYVWYPDKGIFMEYLMLVVDGVNEIYRFCPANSFISGTFLPPGLGTGYQEILLGLGSEYQNFFSSSPFVKTPEQAFGITSEEFYQLFTTSPERCLETPISIWWP